MTDQTISWLRELAAKGGKGVVNNIDARCLGRVADELERFSRPAQRVPDAAIEFEYCNWEGRKSLRQARPISIRFGKSEWHPKPQWLMLAFDTDRGVEREFAMDDMAFEDDALASLALSAVTSTDCSPKGE